MPNSPPDLKPLTKGLRPCRYPLCKAELTSLEQTQMQAFVKIALARLTLIQLASLDEEWEHVCQRRGWVGKTQPW